MKPFDVAHWIDTSMSNWVIIYISSFHVDNRGSLRKGSTLVDGKKAEPFGELKR